MARYSISDTVYQGTLKSVQRFGDHDKFEPLLVLDFVHELVLKTKSYIESKSLSNFFVVMIPFHDWLFAALYQTRHVDIILLQQCYFAFQHIDFWPNWIKNTAITEVGTKADLLS